jgi:hypothetical protein
VIHGIYINFKYTKYVNHFFIVKLYTNFCILPKTKNKKHMKKTIIKLSALSIILLAVSCKKGDTGPAGSTGSTGPNLSGNIQGFITLYDAAGSKILSSLKGDSITLTSNSSSVVLKTVTDSTGKYVLPNITTGNYNLTVSRAGFGTVLSQDMQFTGGGTDFKNAALSQIPTISVSALTAKDSTTAPTIIKNTTDTTVQPEKYIALSGTLTPTAGGSEVIVYVSNPNGTSVSNTLANFSTYYTLAVKAGANTFSLLIPTANLYDLQFTSGNTVYFEAYVIGASTGSSSYVDVTTGKTVFTAINPTGMSAHAVVQ